MLTMIICAKNNRIVLGSVTLALLVLASYGATYRHSDFGTSLVIYPIAKSKCASYYENPVMAVSPIKITVDGVEVRPHDVELWHESEKRATQAQEADTVLIFGYLRSLNFLKEAPDGKSKFIQYNIPDDAEIIAITFRPRYPDDTLGEVVTVVVRRDALRKEKTTTMSLEEFEAELKKGQP